MQPRSQPIFDVGITSSEAFCWPNDQAGARYGLAAAQSGSAERRLSELADHWQANRMFASEEIWPSRHLPAGSVQSGSRRRRAAWLLRAAVVVLVCTVLLAAHVQAQCIVSREHHPWGRFHVGSWKTVRVVTETLDGQGRVTAVSTSETTTTLIGVDQTSYTLRVEGSLEVAGRRFGNQVRIVKKGFDGEDEGQPVTLKQIGPGEVTIGQETIPSVVHQITIQGTDTKQVTTVHYSTQVAPYVLKRTTKGTDLSGSRTDYVSQVDVLAIGMPYQVLSEIKPASFIRTVSQRPGGKVVTIEVQCLDVPGGVVTRTTKEMDQMGRVVRRSTLELVNYGVASRQRRPLQRLFEHLRSHHRSR